MPYMEALIKETLRLFPSVPFFSRKTFEPFTIGNCFIWSSLKNPLISGGIFFIGSITVPPQTNVTILAYMIHRNAEIFPDPEKFQPERFLNEKNLHPFAHVAFSAGPRNCIGQKFAMLELKCSLSKLLRAFEFLPAEGFNIIPVPELILKSSNGIHVKLKKR